MYCEEITLMLRQLNMAQAIADEAGLHLAAIHIENARRSVMDTVPHTAA